MSSNDGSSASLSATQTTGPGTLGCNSNLEATQSRAETYNALLDDTKSRKLEHPRFLSGLRQAGVTAEEARDYIEQLHEHGRLQMQLSGCSSITGYSNQNPDFTGLSFGLEDLVKVLELAKPQPPLIPAIISTFAGISQDNSG
jgi:hypothetical protein